MSDPTAVGQIKLRPAMAWAVVNLRARLGTWITLSSIVFAIGVVQVLGSGPLVRVFDKAVANCSTITSQSCANALGPSGGTVVAVTIALSVIFMLLGAIAKYGVVRAAIGLTKGRIPKASDMLPEQHFGAYVGFSIVFAIMTTIGIGLCIIPGLLVLFFLQLGPFYILDRGYSVGDGIKASILAARHNIMPMLGVSLVNLAVIFISGIAFGILTLIALPFAVMFTAHVYRQICGESDNDLP